MPEPSPYVITQIEWLENKRKLRGAVRKAKSIQVFVHTDYFKRGLEQDTPRHKVPITYAIEMIDALEDDNLPGLATLKTTDGTLVYLLIPFEWSDRADEYIGEAK